MDRLVADFPDKFGRTVSHTSRRPREHEVHASSYFFATKADMLAAAREAAFLEMAAVATCAAGGSGESYLYGTSYATVREVAATGKLCVMGLDVQGVAALQVGPQAEMLQAHRLIWNDLSVTWPTYNWRFIHCRWGRMPLLDLQS